MKILILGGSGMLGHRLWINLSKQHDVYVTVRTQSNPFPDVPEFPKNRVICGVEGLIAEEVIGTIATVKPEVVINCIGIIKQLENSNPMYPIMVNTLLPHQIANVCRAANIRMIHISTDCVFSGNTGSYTELSESDAIDLYGRTKFLGEVYYPHCLTLRTSIIGMELKNYLGLVEWFLRQEVQVHGYTHAIYTGFTTDELSNIINDYVLPNPDLHGLYHVSSYMVNKYELLKLMNKYFEYDTDIYPSGDFHCDRSLNSMKFRNATGYIPPSWDDMISKMASTIKFYTSLKREGVWSNGVRLVRP